MDGSITGHARHGSATTTQAVSAAIQRSQASIAELSRTLGINPKTVAAWRKRKTVGDLKTGPKDPGASVLREDEDAVVVAFRRHMLLPREDCLHALQPSIPHLTRSSVHRCLQRRFQRHGISRLPDVGGDPWRRQAQAPEVHGTLSALSISTLSKSGLRTAGAISLWPLTAPANARGGTVGREGSSQDGIGVS